MDFPDDFLPGMDFAAGKAFDAMDALEAGAIANPDEDRMVGHYWLRNPQLAPTPDLQHEIQNTLNAIHSTVADIHSGKTLSSSNETFTEILVVGIGGSALGPQLVADALSTPDNPMNIHFLDNTDPDGMIRTLTTLKPLLKRTLVIVISKSGGTKETRNGMLEAQHAFKEAGIPFHSHFIAVTGEGSQLDQTAKKENWLAVFPMWDWVGGRTSVLSAVGLLPAALQGISIDQLLAGAAVMDTKTRIHDIRENAAMLLALMWYYAGDGRGTKDMVILPYKDRLVLFSKYLQQLVMESLGKELDLDGKTVNQGIAVYGNKGSTDQHAYVQQLRDGIHNFFLTFIEVRQAQSGLPLEVEPGVTSGDYLQGFLRGTRKALAENGRESMTISIPEVSPFYLGALIALYERAVGFYATLVHINAYHQPGVEAGKKAATAILDLQSRVIAELKNRKPATAESLATTLSADPEDIYHILSHLTANPHHHIQVHSLASPANTTFLWSDASAS